MAIGGFEQMLKGNTPAIVLSLLRRGPMYGYQIIGAIKAGSGGELSPGEGTLYPVLHSLERKGLLEGFWKRAPSGRERKYYRLTAAGEAALEADVRQWRRFRTALERLLPTAAVLDRA